MKRYDNGVVRTASLYDHGHPEDSGRNRMVELLDHAMLPGDRPGKLMVEDASSDPIASDARRIVETTEYLDLDASFVAVDKLRPSSLCAELLHASERFSVAIWEISPEQADELVSMLTDWHNELAAVHADDSVLVECARRVPTVGLAPDGCQRDDRNLVHVIPVQTDSDRIDNLLAVDEV